MDEEHSIKKVWFNRRYRLFSRYDQGIRISDTMWFSITPEEVALTVAERVKARWPGATTVIDLCGGAGGNSIAFARSGFNVIYVDIDPEVLQDAAHNALIYQCPSIDFHLGDIMKIDLSALADPSKTIIHVSPEWGGPKYKDTSVFDVNDCGPPLGKLVKRLRGQGFESIVAYLPKNSNMEQLASMGAVSTEAIYTSNKKKPKGVAHRKQLAINAIWKKKADASNENSDGESDLSSESSSDSSDSSDGESSQNGSLPDISPKPISNKRKHACFSSEDEDSVKARKD